MDKTGTLHSIIPKYHSLHTRIPKFKIIIRSVYTKWAYQNYISTVRTNITIGLTVTNAKEDHDPYPTLVYQFWLRNLYMIWNHESTDPVKLMAEEQEYEYNGEWNSRDKNVIQKTFQYGLVISFRSLSMNNNHILVRKGWINDFGGSITLISSIRFILIPPFCISEPSLKESHSVKHLSTNHVL